LIQINGTGTVAGTVPGNSKIEHVFVLMLENRSFDHMLGFSGISGTDAVSGKKRTIPAPTGENTYKDVTYSQSTPGLNPMPVDPAHEFPDVVEQLCGPGKTYPRGGPYPPITNAGYVSNYCKQPGGTFPPTPGDPLRCFTREQVPVLTALAESFVVCDQWWSSMPGPTWPNRMFLNAASSGGLDHTPDWEDILFYMAFGYSFEHGTIFDRLHAMGLPWKVYHGDAWPLAFALKGMTRYWLEGYVSPYERFAQDIQSDYKPAYTFIEPSYGAVMTDFTCGTSQHPLDDVTRGEWLIKCTYEAIRNSRVWETSMLIVTWDEHGGFYDHTTPPGKAPAPETSRHGRRTTRRTSTSRSTGYGFPRSSPRL
jgi:phospholipase C